jgi:anaerobic dimethyl sulfoxide reductase subunit A
VENGVARRLETDSQYRACVRGRAYRQRLYATDRVIYPLKRTGERGSGQFERITWDEAFDTVAAQLKRVRDQYGPESLALISSGGDIVHLHSAALVETLLSRIGGFTGTWGMHSAEGAWFASMVTYGDLASGNSREDLMNSALIILWGWNPAVTIAYANTAWHIKRAKEAGARVISIDPRHTSTTATLADQWIPIRPGTDTAMMMAMAYVIIKDDIYDREFITRHTIGFKQFEDYVMGIEDGVPKTLAWAEAITGVPAETIATLARDYARVKPAALMDGLAVGRTAYGEQFHRAAATLSAMTGNVGNSGGNAAGYSTIGGRGPFFNLGPRPASRMKNSVNPVEVKAGRRPLGEFASLGGPSSARLSRFHLADAILNGKRGGYPSDIKLLYVMTCNYLNQCSDINRIAQALESLEFIVVHEQFITSTARYADIIFPAATYMERNDVCTGGIAPFYGFQNKVVEPLGESKSHYDICRGLAERLGVSDYSPNSEAEWLNEVVNGCPDLAGKVDFKKEGIHRLDLGRPFVLFKNNVERQSPEKFGTPSGKIEIYSQRLADIGNPELPPIPKYIETWESLNDPLIRKYPLQLVTSHTTRRSHSTFETLPWLSELYPQNVFMNEVDAKARGIRNGDLVRVYNDRGELASPVCITNRMMPGVVDVPEGSWYKPDRNGLDRGGNPNVLSKACISPGGAFPSNTALVQVEKIE